MSGAFGQVIKGDALEASFLSTPGYDLIPKLLLQMASVPQLASLFGPYTPGSDQQRWAGYQRYDWSIRQLPVINVFESQPEEKESDQAFLNGAIQIQVFWPGSMRRGDFRNVPAAFKGIMQNFFSSQYCSDMLDEIYYTRRPMKVYGLNKLGNEITWNPTQADVIENELVPMTTLDVKYKLDLRSWYRALEFLNRTKENPFQVTLAELGEIGGTLEAMSDQAVVYSQEIEFDVNSQEGPL